MVETITLQETVEKSGQKVEHIRFINSFKKKSYMQELEIADPDKPFIISQTTKAKLDRLQKTKTERKVKVLFLSPPAASYVYGKKISKDVTAKSPPLGMAYALAVLKHEGYDTYFLDADVDRLSKEEI